jgi:hypothetical protein
VAAVAAVEIAFNVFPATPSSSATLALAHGAVVVATLRLLRSEAAKALLKRD